jgi:hypothetical protein
LLQSLLYFTLLIAIVAPHAYPFAAACHHPWFRHIKRQWQTADRTFTKIALIGLCKQSIITYFGHPLLASLFMLRSMIFLTFNAAIFHESTSGAYLEFYLSTSALPQEAHTSTTLSSSACSVLPLMIIITIERSSTLIRKVFARLFPNPFPTWHILTIQWD